MAEDDLWRRYCSFYEKDFSDQVQYNRDRMRLYFAKWKKTDLARMLYPGNVRRLRDVPVTTYRDYGMLREFGQRMSDAGRRTPRRQEEPFKEYYDRIGREIGSSLSRYMTEPYYLCMTTTGTTGENKWIAHGETFWKNFFPASLATAVVSCSDGWGETKLRNGDKALNMNASIPYISGWGALASQAHLRLIPPIQVSDNLRDMKEKFNLVLKAIRKGERIALGGGIGSIFYMICKYFSEPEVFYKEYYNSMDLGLRKALLYLKLLQIRLSKKERRAIVDYMPLKGVLVAGMESRLYMDFFRDEFDLEPLHVYGSTEAGPLMRGDPDRKTSLVPDLRTSYLEFMTEGGEVRDLDELRRGEVYEVVVTPFGSILFRYDMEDLVRVVDFRDDGMPIFAFDGRKMTRLTIYTWYVVTPNVIVQALSKAGLNSSDKWAVIKLLKPKEHLRFVMEKTWSLTEKEAERIIFESLLQTEKSIPQRGHTLGDYVTDFGIRDPSEVVRVEYLKPGAFLRYSMIRARAGYPIGQYKAPRIIPAEKMEIYETLRNA